MSDQSERRGCTPMTSVVVFLAMALLASVLIYFLMIMYLAYRTD